MSDTTADKIAELSSNFDVEVVSVENNQLPHVVIALHGIRDNSSWSHKLISDASPFNDKIEIVPVSYERIGIIAFLMNFASSKIDDDVVNKIENIKKAYSGNPVSIMCHSNGTKILSRISKKINFVPEYIFLVGSVCHVSDYNKFKVRRRAINECGLKDFWPIFAETFRPSVYGATGVFGFNNYPIKDRHFYYGHSEGLEKKHFEDWIIPVITTGRIQNKPEKESKYSISISHYVRYALVFLAMLVFACICFLYFSS